MTASWAFSLLLAVAVLARPATSQSSIISACAVWAQSTALSNGTIWLYGGNRRDTSGQTANTWNSDLFALDISTNFATSAPPVSLLQAGGGQPPAVALGALFINKEGSSLYQLNGEFSDSPDQTPSANALWRYDVAGKSWGTVSSWNDQFRVAEGAPAIAAGAGTDKEPLAFYFGGHVDGHTMADWSDQTPRLYLSSLQSLDLGSLSMQNITQSASAAGASVGTGNSTAIPSPAARADSTLTFIPGLGTNKKGILVSIGGGTADNLLTNDGLDVYDMGSQSWAHQPTNGSPLSPRVNHCAVRGSASVNGVMQHQVYIFGGQTLGGATSYNDLSILNIPSFTWTSVGTLPNGPSPRAGHSCHLIGSQMIVVGGYQPNGCDSSLFSVFNTASMAWQPSFQARSYYQTPQIVANITGGIGAATSDSPSSSTSANPDNGSAGQPYSANGSGSATNAGSSGPGPEGGVTTAGGSGSDAGSVPGSNGNGDTASGGEMQTPQSSDGHTGRIVGAIVGALAGLVLLVAGVAWLKRRRQKTLTSYNAHRRLVSDISDGFSEDGSVFSADSASFAAHRYEDWSMPLMSSIGNVLPLRRGADYDSVEYASKPPTSSSSGAYSNLSDDDFVGLSYVGPGSGRAGSLRVANGHSRSSSTIAASSSGHTSTPLAYDYAVPTTVFSSGHVGPASGEDADDEYDGGPSRSTSGKTKSSGFDRNNDMVAVFDGDTASPRLSKRMELSIANPSARSKQSLV